MNLLTRRTLRLPFLLEIGRAVEVAVVSEVKEVEDELPLPIFRRWSRGSSPRCRDREDSTTVGKGVPVTNGVVATIVVPICGAIVSFARTKRPWYCCDEADGVPLQLGRCGVLFV